MAHKDIRIPFEIGGRRYEAVGFLKAWESSVSGDVMLARTADENGGAIGEEDAKYIGDHLNQVPATIRRHNPEYVYLVTNRRSAEDPDQLFYLCFYGRGWSRGFFHLSDEWKEYGLVIRHLP